MMQAHALRSRTRACMMQAPRPRRHQMDTQDFVTNVTIDAPPAAVFDAINDVRGWWSQEVDGDTDRIGAEFGFRGHDDENTVEHISRIRVTELVPAQRRV